MIIKANKRKTLFSKLLEVIADMLGMKENQFWLQKGRFLG